MEKSGKLTPRLMAVAQFVRTSVKIADIGTDHAHLPIFLYQNGLVKSALACDIREGPILRASENIRAAGVGCGVEARRCDGLSGVFPKEADDIIIAGMGGELIWELIEKTRWLFTPDKRLILQPMTNEMHLRKKLWENGFCILRERTVSEGRRVYVILNAVFCGKKENKSDYDCMVGLIANGGADDARYLTRVLERAKNKRVGFLHNGNEEKACEYEQAINKLKEMLEGGK